MFLVLKLLILIIGIWTNFSFLDWFFASVKKYEFELSNFLI